MFAPVLQKNLGSALPHKSSSDKFDIDIFIEACWSILKPSFVPGLMFIFVTGFPLLDSGNRNRSLALILEAILSELYQHKFHLFISREKRKVAWSSLPSFFGMKLYPFGSVRPHITYHSVGVGVAVCPDVRKCHIGGDGKNFLTRDTSLIKK